MGLGGRQKGTWKQKRKTASKPDYITNYETLMT